MLFFGVGKECPMDVPVGGSILFDRGNFTIFIKMSDLYKEDIKAFRDNELRLALCTYDPKVSFFVYGIKGFVYACDVAFNINKTANKLGDLTVDFIENTGYPFTFVLIEEETNIIKAMRMVGTTKEMSEAINHCCIEQEKAGLDEYEETISKVYSQYSPEKMVTDLLVRGCRFKGND